MKKPNPEPESSGSSLRVPELEPAGAGDDAPAIPRRLFAGRTARGAEGGAHCCSPVEQEACCAPEQKASCCAAAAPSCACA